MITVLRRRSLVVLCVAVLVCGLCLPTARAHFPADLVPLWPAVQSFVSVFSQTSPASRPEQSRSLLSLGGARSPPAALS